MYALERKPKVCRILITASLSFCTDVLLGFFLQNTTQPDGVRLLGVI